MELTDENMDDLDNRPDRSEYAARMADSEPDYIKARIQQVKEERAARAAAKTA